VTDADTTYAEAAAPVLGGSYALLVRDPVELGSIRLVERRVLLAAGVALLIALLLGYVGARMFARRIRRLERAADRIANGRFDEPVVDTGGGELGALAAAFDACAFGWPTSTTRAGSSSPTPRTSCARPLFSLAGFLELLDDEELDEPTRREFLVRCASRSTA
jgi:HAMP domain-containing protein